MAHGADGTLRRVDPAALEAEAQSAIAAAATSADLEEARVRYLGRNAALPQALRQVRDRETGQTLNALRARLEEAVAARRATLEGGELDRRLAEEVVDVTLPGEATPRGHLHLITQIRREVEDVFLGLGYRVVDGREVETAYYNFTALNMPPWHPARSSSAPRSWKACSSRVRSALSVCPVSRSRTWRSACGSSALRPRKRTRAASSSADVEAAAIALFASISRVFGSTA